MKALVCGDRNWTNRQYLYRILDALHAHRKFSILIEGEAKGADRMARDWAIKNKVSVRKFPAMWMVYGKGAGVIRNQQMLDEGKPDIIIAFHNDISASTGTRDMVRRARGKLIHIQLYKEGDLVTLNGI